MWKLTVSIFMITIVVALTTFRQTVNSATLQGVISDSVTAQPISGAVVKILETGDSTVSDAGGEYIFASLSDGSYTLLVGRPEYVPQIKTVQLGGYICGDASGDLTINISDAVFLINYIFKGGPAPNPLQAGDVNADSTINIADIVYLVSYIFRGGPAPQCP